MGMSGFRIIRFRGRHWIFCHHSRAEFLGQWLVNSVPTNPEQYQEWLQSQRDTFSKWDSLLQEFLTIHPEDMQKLRSDEPLTPVFHAAFDNKMYRNAPPYYKPGPDHYPLRCAYTIDLDRELFSVDNSAHFRLNHIPRNNKWVKALFQDSHRNTTLLPHLVPAESVATLVLDPPGFTVSTNHAKLQTRIVKPKNLDLIPSSTRTGPRLRWMLFNLFQRSQRIDLSVNLLGWRAQDLPFRELTFFILCLAKGGEHLALMDQRSIKMPYSGALYVGLKTRSSFELDVELASCLGVGYHMAGLPIGSAPEETKYWFEGALICLVSRLDYPGNLEPAIANAIEYGRANCTTTSFNAILISIEHLVLIKSLPDGTVDHTDLLPLVLIPSHFSKDTRARYGPESVDRFHTTHRDTVKLVTEDSKESDVEEVSQNLRQQDPRDDGDTDHGKSAEATEENGKRAGNGAVTGTQPEEEAAFQNTKKEEESTASDDKSIAEGKRSAMVPATEASIRTTFMALVQFFEATTLETLRPTGLNQARLPEEVCEMVVRNVYDMKTYNACLKVSRGFRLICQRRTLVMDNIVFLAPLPRNPALSVTQKKGKNIHDPQPSPDFRVVEVSSDRQMNVLLHSAPTRLERLECLIVAGKELNRKTFAGFTVVFQGLHVPLPGADKAGKHMIRTAELGNFWMEALGNHGFPIESSRDLEWTFPPHTTCYFVRQASYHSKEDVTHVKMFYYVYLRLKRASKYWSSQWDEIIREATEHLNHTDDDGIRSWGFPEGEVIGADEPYVILIVGLQVRLFKWKQGFDESVDETSRRQMSRSSRLREEPDPGKVLNVTEKSDREEIEKFLGKARRYKHAITARASQRHKGWNRYIWDRS